jgi:hypothetical protein
MRTAIPRSEVAGMVKTMAVATVHQVIGTQVANKVAVPCLQATTIPTGGRPATGAAQVVSTLAVARTAVITFLAASSGLPHLIRASLALLASTRVAGDAMCALLAIIAEVSQWAKMAP